MEGVGGRLDDALEMTPAVRTAERGAAIGPAPAVAGCKTLETESPGDKASFQFGLMLSAAHDVVELMYEGLIAGSLDDEALPARGLADADDAHGIRAAGKQRGGLDEANLRH